MRLLRLLLIGSVLLPAALSAQDPEGVRLGLMYQPEYQPGLVVLPFQASDGAGGIASMVQGIVAQDLDYSDRFQLRSVTDGPVEDPINLDLWKERGADWVLQGTIAPRSGGFSLSLTLHDAVYGRVKDQRTIALPAQGDPNFRMAVHAAADEVVFWATGDQGMAASRVVFVLEGRGSKEIYMVDSDGENVQRVTSDGTISLSPAWGPDGTIAYTSYRSGRPILYERDLRTGRDRVLSDREGVNAMPAYSPDGRLVAFSTSVAGNTEIATFDRNQNCCLQQQTRGRQFDSFNATFSPDGRRLAFISDRLGQPHLYIMDLGGDPRLISEYSYGSRIKNDAPDWSPDGQKIVYQSEISPGNHQLMLADLDRGNRRVLTNQGNNETPSWAPDGRHVVFSSKDRDGGGLFVLDTVSGRIRPLLRGQGYGLPDWSGTLYRVARE